MQTAVLVAVTQELRREIAAHLGARSFENRHALAGAEKLVLHLVPRHRNAAEAGDHGIHFHDACFYLQAVEVAIRRANRSPANHFVDAVAFLHQRKKGRKLEAHLETRAVAVAEFQRKLVDFIRIAVIARNGEAAERQSAAFSREFAAGIPVKIVHISDLEGAESDRVGYLQSIGGESPEKVGRVHLYGRFVFVQTLSVRLQAAEIPGLRSAAFPVVDRACQGGLRIAEGIVALRHMRSANGDLRAELAQEHGNSQKSKGSFHVQHQS